MMTAEELLNNATDESRFLIGAKANDPVYLERRVERPADKRYWMVVVILPGFTNLHYLNKNGEWRYKVGSGWDRWQDAIESFRSVLSKTTAGF